MPRSPLPLLRSIACTYPRSPMAGDAVEAVESPMQGTIVSVDVRPGDVVRLGQQLLVIESMKMEHVINADTGGAVADVRVAPGDTVNPGDVLIRLDPAGAQQSGGEGGVIAPAITAKKHDGLRSDLSEVVERQAMTTDERRPDAVARRRKTGQ